MDVTIRVTIAFSLSDIYRATPDSCLAWCLFPSNSILLLLLFSGVIVSLHSGLMAQALAMSINIPTPIVITIWFHTCTGFESKITLRSVIISWFLSYFSKVLPSRDILPVRDLFALYNCRIVSARLLNYFQESGWTLRWFMNATIEKPLGEATLDYLIM